MHHEDKIYASKDIKVLFTLWGSLVAMEYRPKSLWLGKKKTSWLCHKEGHADPPPSFRNDPIKKWLEMVRNILNRTRKWIKKNSDFYF